KTKGSRSRLFGRKPSKQTTSKRPVPPIQTNNLPQNSPPPKTGFVDSSLSKSDVFSPRNNRANRASILLTADEFDALANANSYPRAPLSPNSSTQQCTPMQGRKRDLSVVASDMSSTTRMDSEKVQIL